MQNNYGQRQQMPPQPQQPQYQQYPGYPYPQKPKGNGGIFALLGFIFSLAAILFEMVGLIVGGASGPYSGGNVVFIIFMFLAFALAGTGTVFSALALLKNKGKKLFAQIGLIAGIAAVTIFIADLYLLIMAF